MNLLVVEDERLQRELLSELLRKEGFNVFEASSAKEAESQLRINNVDVCLLDLRLPDTDGLNLLTEIKRLNPEIDVIIITAFGSVESAVHALKSGASDYLLKPINFEDLLLRLKRIEEKRELLSENLILKEALRENLKDEEFIYSSGKMQEVVSLIVRVSKTDSTVIVEGESGVGKEVVVRLIHKLSKRAKYPLIKVNCASIPETLLESELFGYEKGAFTGAYQRKPGKFELADCGTLFLDEIGEMPLSIQPKLLRAIQEKEFERLGGIRPIKVDVRIIAATNKNLEDLVKRGLFREDLYYRLNVVKIHIPPLRERKEDIPFLIDYFIEKFNKKHAKRIKGISKEARDALLKYDYPGNVRELENIIERACILTRGEYILTENLFPSAASADRAESGGLRKAVESLEKALILDSLKRCEWIQTKAAEDLKISERMLRYKMKKYGIRRD